MMNEINFVTKSLQTRNYMIHCRDDLNILIAAEAKEKSDPSSNFCQYKLGKKYIASRSVIVKNKDFQSAVMKLQK